MSASLDFRAIVAQADLRSLVEADCGGPGRGGSYRCPFHDDRRKPNLKLTRDGKRFKCWACGASGTALDWLMLRQRLTVVEAARELASSAPASSRQGNARDRSHAVATVVAPAPDDHPWRDPEWQRVAGALVRRAVALLWSVEGRRARAWLHGRGLEDRTIREFRIGYLPAPIRTAPLECLGLDDRDRPRGIYAFRGITFPLVAPGAWYALEPDPGPEPRWCGVSVRRLTEAFTDPVDGIDKCMSFPGSRFGYAYPLPDLVPGLPPLVTEGHIDALLAWQEAGALVNAITVGGASHRPRPEALAALDSCDPWLLALDHDSSGRTAAESIWAELAPRKVRRLVLPSGKDVGEYVQGGGDLPAWLDSEFRRLGLPWPMRERPAGEALFLLLAKLNARGVRLDDATVYPRIAVGTITGRVTYRDPALQTLPKADRLARITPVVEGRIIVRADYEQIEPRVLLRVLRDRGLITWNVGPGEDLYRVLVGDALIDRDEVKVLVNKIVNGGRYNGHASNRLAEYIRAADTHRDELAASARAEGCVRTLAGRKILLAACEANHGGKAVNRVVQGTAADIFNRAAVAVDARLEAEGLPAVITFLLFDEMWVECAADSIPRVQDLVRSEMEAAALADGVTVPARIDPGGAIP